MKRCFAIIEVGSNNTKTHIYEGDNIIYDNNMTIEFKKKYKKLGKIDSNDLDLLYSVISKALEFTSEVHVYGCSIFRNISSDELYSINTKLFSKYGVSIEVVSQEDEALYTALGCYSDISYDKKMCIFIGGGGSIELIFVKNRKIIGKKYYDFGVVDITEKFESLKDDIPNISFDDVYNYVANLIGNIEFNSDILVLAGGDHLYWYNSVGYKLLNNDLYTNKKQKYLITRELSDTYDNDCFEISFDKVRKNSDNPSWFDGARAMKVFTNVVSHKINAKYIIPTRINMEDGIRGKLINC